MDWVGGGGGGGSNRRDFFHGFLVCFASLTFVRNNSVTYLGSVRKVVSFPASSILLRLAGSDVYRRRVLLMCYMTCQIFFPGIDYRWERHPLESARGAAGHCKDFNRKQAERGGWRTGSHGKDRMETRFLRLDSTLTSLRFGQPSYPWPCNSVKIEINVHLKYKLRFFCAQLILRQMHGTSCQ